MNIGVQLRPKLSLVVAETRSSFLFRFWELERESVSQRMSDCIPSASRTRGKRRKYLSQPSAQRASESRRRAAVVENKCESDSVVVGREEKCFSWHANGTFFFWWWCCCGIFQLPLNSSFLPLFFRNRFSKEKQGFFGDNVLTDIYIRGSLKALPRMWKRHPKSSS